MDDWDLKGLSEALFDQFGLSLNLDHDRVAEMGYDAFTAQVEEEVRKIYGSQESDFGPELWPELLRWVMLKHVDNQWKDHLLGMDHLKEGIGLRGYGQREPLKEYQREGFELFGEMIERISSETVRELYRVKLARPEEVAELTRPEETPLTLSHSEEAPDRTVKRTDKKIGRNAPCPCGSGKKYKKCCGRAAA